MRYTHFVFDIDNTLINTTGAVLHGLQRALRDVTGKHWDLSRLTPVLGIPGLDAFERLGIHSLNRYSRFIPVGNSMNRSISTLPICMRALSSVGFLKKGCVLGIITSKTMPQYTSSFLPFQISEYFQTVITADDTVRHKPDPEPMLAYMERTGVCPRQILYIGDSIYDMQCAAQAGVDSCLALWGCHCPDGILSTHRFEEPAGMMRWLE